MLIRKLKDRQHQEGLTDGAFANKLRISRQLWGMIKKNGNPIGSKLITGIIREYPELTVDVLVYFQENGKGSILSPLK